jgi:hypothetical protein
MGTGMMTGGMMMWPDSMFMTFDRMPADSLPFMPHAGALLGFHMDAFNPAGALMMQGGMMGGHGMMGLQRAMHMRIRVHPDTLVRHGLMMSQMRLKYLDIDNTWKDVANQSQDVQASAITADQASVFSYLALTPSGATAIDGERQSRPTAFSLEQNYPNPFNPSTSIQFALPREALVSLEVYNLLGEKIATLVSANLPAGVNTQIWNAAGYPSGVYFYKLSAGSFVQTKRLVLTR